MNNLLTQSALGIFVGVLSAFFVSLLKWGWLNIVSPRLQEMKYRGVDVAGKWRGSEVSDDGEFSSEVELAIQQSAHSLSGLLHLKFKSPGHSYELLFTADGLIWEGYANLRFSPVDRRVTSSAVALLKVSGGGTGLVGQFAYRNVNDERVDAFPLSLARVI